MQDFINPELNHDLLVAKVQPKLGYNADHDYDEWKKAIREKFIDLTGLDEIEKNACPLNVKIIDSEKKDGYTLTRFTFDSEVGETVPCYLCVPDTGKEKYPVAIVLQGHSTGFHLSIGEKKFPQDESYQEKGRGSFALQAVKNGFVALAIEQRGMGIRKSRDPYRLPENNCQYASRVALALGRTIIGERVWDVHKAIDVLKEFPVCDTDKILITGNSGGGTMSYYAACYDDRIKLSVPSCAFCSYKESILSIAHCACNYIPSQYKYFDMQDLSCLIAPRKLVIVAGKKDPIFPIEGVRRGYETVKAVYKKSGKENNCSLVETPREHWWCDDLVWNAIDVQCHDLGWK